MPVRGSWSGKGGSPRPARLHFLTVIPSPYQRETFRAINASGSLTASVDYYAATARDRRWNAEPPEPHETILPGMRFPGPGAVGRFSPTVLRRLREVDADIVVVSDYSVPTAQLAMRWLTAAGRRWLYWGEVPGVNPRGAIGHWARRRLQAPLGGATGIVAIGSRAAAAYGELFPRVPIFDIPYFCDLERFRRVAEARAPADDGRVRVLFSGQLIARKGVDLLMRAFAEALPQAPDLELRILGEGPMRPGLERAAAAFGERVVFLGHRDPADLPAVFAEADLFILPSRHDGWGVVINEALGAGLPIVASEGVGAAHDLVAHGVNGFVVGREDVRGLRDALVLLARDPARRRAMAEASLSRAASWGLGEAVRRWESLCAVIFAAPDAATGGAPDAAPAAAPEPALERGAP